MSNPFDALLRKRDPNGLLPGDAGIPRRHHPRADAKQTEIRARWLAFRGTEHALIFAAAADDCANAFKACGRADLARNWAEIAGGLRQSAATDRGAS
jgi:hypothetical protein